MHFFYKYLSQKSIHSNYHLAAILNCKLKLKLIYWSIALPKDDISYIDEIRGQFADLAMWNEDGELEERSEVDYLMYKKDLQHYDHPMKTCKGSGASMVRRKDKESTILVGILGKADPSCENEINKQRTLATVTHPEVLNFINASKKGLKIQLKKKRLKRLPV